MSASNFEMKCPRITITFNWSAVLLCIVNIIFTFAGTILNSVVILSLWNSQLRKKLCYFMIFILACFDLAVVVVIHPLIIFEIISSWMSLDINECWIDHIIYILFSFSLYALLTMTLERYVALVYPFFHHKFVTKSRLMILFVLLQLPLYMLCIIIGENNLYLHPILYSVDGVVFVIICILNIKLFFVARTLRDRAVVTLGNLDGSEPEQRNNLDSKKYRITFSSLGKISTCLLSVMCLIICNLPWTVYFGVKRSNASISDQNMFILERWAETFCALNSSLNCLIFFYKNSVLRRHGKNFLKTCFCGRL